MVNREQIQGQWNEVKGRLREHWGQLTDNDLQRAKGSAEELVGVVQERTGATRSEVEQFLDNLFNDGARQLGDAAHRYSEAAQQVAGETAEYMRDQYQRAAAASGDYATKMSQTVRSRPTESLVIAFGLGIAAGALLFLGKKR